MKTIAPKVRSLREHMGFSIAELAKRSDLSGAYISKLEAMGYQSLSIETCRALARGFDITLKDFFEELGILKDDRRGTEMIHQAFRVNGYTLRQTEAIMDYAKFIKKSKPK